MSPSAIIEPTMDLQKRAYVTFLAGNGDYVKGCGGFSQRGCIVREIEPVYPPENQTQFAMAYYVINYSKLRIWEFVDYGKMIYLDGDIQVFDNIDHLFEKPSGYFYAVMDCFCEKTWSSSPQYQIKYCQQCPEKVQWPLEMGSPPPLYFNAGMFLYEPNLVTYYDLLETLKTTPPTSFAEQDFLNMFFRDVYQPIPPVYNLVSAMLWRHPENFDVDEVKVVHYCAAGAKPWRFTGKEENMDREDIKVLVKKWWEIYEDESLDYKNATAPGGQERLGPLIAALTGDAVVNHMNLPSAA
ncbi:hypothetical protein OIU78_006789 [Salix suchowensis]|nr:hypothetical protein OIU78_006789 [Salix suchowensis]